MNYKKSTSSPVNQQAKFMSGLSTSGLQQQCESPDVPATPTLRYGCVEMQSELAQIRSKVKSIRSMIFGECDEEKCSPDVGNAPISSVVYSLAECLECVRDIHEAVNSVLDRL